MAKGIMLDAGCGNKPYEDFFTGKIDYYVGIDMQRSPLVNRSVDVFCSVMQLSFKDESFSTILCTEVLQQTNKPQEVFKEFYRVLKKEGTLILTTVQMWQITNAPFDSFRFTEYGLKYLAQSAGFRIYSHMALGSFWLRMGLKFCYFINKFARWKILDLPIGLSLIIPQVFFLCMDKLFFGKKDVINHFIIAIRP